jgi:hypothetical protein
MPMWLWAFGQIAWSFICSRVGNILVAAVIAFIWGQHRADVACRKEAEATQIELQRAYWGEIERQRKAAKEIEARALQRAGEDAVISRAMQAKIDEFAKKESENVPPQSKVSVSSRASSPAPRPCVVDDELARVVRSLDNASHGSRAPSNAPRWLR